MKIFVGLVLVSAITFGSCTVSKHSCCKKTHNSTFILRFGDDRFHDDGELLDEFYSVHDKDTVHTHTKQRVRNSKPTQYVKVK
tara:strand:- start:1827 stop:2075 length:249 start_codon:yes stop_codon:yes gene_type:complete